MTSTKPTSEETVAKLLASREELTAAEIATAIGLGRSTVGKTLAALERMGMARRSRGGREGGRRLPHRWSAGSRDERSPAQSSTQRLGPGQLDRLVLEFVNAHGKDTPLGVTAVAKALGRSAGAVGNCLVRLSAARHVRQVSCVQPHEVPEHPAPLHRGRRERMASRDGAESQRRRGTPRPPAGRDPYPPGLRPG
jgi:DNA-binding transcriptional ArsR family regulator